MKKRAIGLIPVRLNSSRLFRKALLEIDRIPLVVHTYKKACLSKKLKMFYMYDSKEISDIAKNLTARL